MPTSPRFYKHIRFIYSLKGGHKTAFQFVIIKSISYELAHKNHVICSYSAV